MERRKILLGSGTVLATVLAGCSSSETDDPKSDDSDDNSFGDDGKDEKDDKDDKGDTNGEKDGKDDDKDHENDKDDKDDHKIPGFKKGKVKLESDLLSIKKIKRDGKKLYVVVDTKTLDEDKLAAEIESLVKTHKDAIVDPEKFAAEIDTIYWTVEHEKNLVASFYVEVDWIIKHLKGKLTLQELVDKIAATAQ
ncbi:MULTISPECIES: hypothetical protein [Natrialbaceae]|uniref:hypothetical protein n=1 Tax=Natrialbaceae TaxID=1644061 RepID=UPI00207C477E|nr:hypothetical protein [Natronococcus sp. CG52]